MSPPRVAPRPAPDGYGYCVVDRARSITHLAKIEVWNNQTLCGKAFHVDSLTDAEEATRAWAEVCRACRRALPQEVHP